MTQVESTNVSPAVAEAKALRDGRKIEVGEEIELSTGVRVILRRVPPGLLEDVVNRVKDPEVPIFYDTDKDREIPNPSHPDYLRAKEQANRDRSVAIIETTVLFGIELVDGLPEEEAWLKNLRFLSKRGVFDLDAYDLDDNLDKEFLYKRYIALGEKDFVLLTSLVSGIDPKEIEKAQRSFPDDEAREANRRGIAQEDA